MVPDAASIADKQTTLDRQFDIVLEPVSHPELADVRVDRELFAVGRTHPPFASAKSELVAGLSRRHARIFCEGGAAYVADLGSKNGTAVNGVDVTEKPHVLHDGDELRFGRALAYRVTFVPRAARQPAPRTTVVTLTPERADLGLQPLVITAFPFLVSKTDDTFACYRRAFPHQVNYLSRRHAHIYVDDDDVFVEDLGSTNGTFVDGRRLDEHAKPLRDGAVLAFGGDHFVYRVGVQRGTASDPTVTATASSGPNAAPADPDRTTFVGTAHSFLDIFCTAPTMPQEDEVNPQAAAAAAAAARDAHRRRGRFERFLSEMSEAVGGSGEIDMRRLRWWGGGIAAALAAVLAVTLVHDAPQREMKDLLASGDVARAARVADGYLARHPDDPAFTGMATEALVRSEVPAWIDAMNAHAFDRARGVVRDMRALARNNADARPLVDALAWVGDLEAFVVGRGGPDAPIRIYRDEAPIRTLTGRWNDDPSEHQRMLDRISSYVPAFGPLYADALSHLRKLQSDHSVYVAALERLQREIGTALDENRVDGLPALIADYEQRYPRLGGLDAVRADLRQYAQLDADALAGHGQAVLDRLKQTRFATPQFQAHVATLARLASTGEHGENRPAP